MINTIILGNALIELPKLPSGIANCVVTSPPYWGLRDYGVDPVIWDGDKGCEHDFDNINRLHPTRGNRVQGVDKKYPIRESQQPTEIKSNFCLKCNAWRGSLGLEPTFELYIKHLCDIFDEVKRVLRKDGTCWVNLGDSYANTGVVNKSEWKHKETVGTIDKKIKISLSNKSLCDIPYHFSIEMVTRGWIKRNTIIWHKPNCMPSSANDRFTIDFEYLFFFTKNNKAIFWTNEKTLECVGKKPLGTKGIEGKDWEWRETQNWKEEESAGYEMGATDPHRAASIGGLKLGAKHKKSGKLKKVSLWTGHDYWFEQQFEELESNLYDINRLRTKPNYHNKTDQTAVIGRATSKHIKQGRNKRAVWTIPTQPFPEAHFAVYPEGLIEYRLKPDVRNLSVRSAARRG